jgi:hypothetical protein
MANDKVPPNVEWPPRIRTADDLRQLINDVRIRLEEANKPAGPLRIFKLTTST